MSNKENLLLRIKAVQALDQLYYQKGEHLYSHRRVWRSRPSDLRYQLYDLRQLPSPRRLASARSAGGGRDGSPSG